MVFIKSIVALSITVAASTMALNVANIADCPALSARNSTATGITDLRIDDIKVVGALGDR